MSKIIFDSGISLDVSFAGNILYHRNHRNHTKEFYELLASEMPDWKK